MGYQRKRKIYKLSFTGDEELEGLEVYANSLSISQMLELADLAEEAGAVDGAVGSLDADKLTPGNIDAVKSMLKHFAKALRSWNLDDENGKRVPATLKGIQDQDLDFILRLIGEWMTAISGVDKSLGKGSTSGLPSLEGLIRGVERSPSP